jgi:DNA-directed RNA polymerase specialized sigma24 family protein
MDGATLRLLDSLRGVAYPGGPHTRTALEAFARLLIGWPLEPADARWIEQLAARAELDWNGERAEPFRLIYEAARSRGQRIDVTDARMASPDGLVLEGLMLLPLRERAGIATSCVLGFTQEEVGHVIGAPAQQVDVVLDAAVALLRGRVTDPDGESEFPAA